MKLTVFFKFLANILVFWLTNPVLAQDKYELNCIVLDQSTSLKQFHYQKQHPDSLSVVKEVTLLIQNLQKQSYLHAKYDSIVFQNKKVVAFIKFGTGFRWKKLGKGNLNERIFSI